MDHMFEAIGYQLGKTAAKAKNLFDLLGGDDEESLRAEILLGRDLAAALLQRMPLIEENASTSFAEDVGRWLAGHLKERRMPFAFRITADEALNALAFPGGPVFVSWPLLELCQGRRDEIAFVLAHEMGHIVLRHAAERTFRDSVFSVLLQQSSSRNAAIAWLEKVGQQGLSRAYSRESELEADDFAISLIRSCGGNVLAGEQLLEKLAQRSPNQNVAAGIEFLATHPPVTDRIAHMRSQRTALAG
jgi:predicted Zn-dependent protease